MRTGPAPFTSHTHAGQTFAPELSALLSLRDTVDDHALAANWATARMQSGQIDCNSLDGALNARADAQQPLEIAPRQRAAWALVLPAPVAMRLGMVTTVVGTK